MEGGGTRKFLILWYYIDLKLVVLSSGLYDGNVYLDGASSEYELRFSVKHNITYQYRYHN